jgi:hypothetical protein
MRIRWVPQLLLPGRREWDEQTVKACFYPPNVEEILRIRLADSCLEDHIAWNYERTGIFSVKSADKLALQLKRDGLGVSCNSTGGDGSWPLYKEIWATDVPSLGCSPRDYQKKD